MSGLQASTTTMMEENVLLTEKKTPLKSNTKWEKYLLQHRCQTGQEPTHTRITGGSYHFPDNILLDMMRLYWQEVVNKGRVETLTEKQREGGPLLVDLDFKFAWSPAVEPIQRQYTKQHVDTIVKRLTGVVYEMLDTTDGFDVYVMEKPEPVLDKEGTVLKDGLHLLVNVASSVAMQTYVRERCMDLLPDALSDLALVNEWEHVLDASIARGTTNWQMYGSRKPDKKPYVLTQHIKVVSPEEFQVIPVAGGGAPSWEQFQTLSARVVERPVWDASLVFNQWQMKRDAELAVRGGTTARKHPLSMASDLLNKSSSKKSQMPMETMMAVTNKEEWSAVMQEWLDTASMEWKLLHEFVMALPSSYYELGKGTREKWIATCWALRNTSYGLLPIWIDFSAQATGFQWSYLGSLVEEWERDFGQGASGGLTKRSIMYWCKQESPEAYHEINKRDVDAFIEQCAMNPTHEDLAQILFKLYRNDFVCTKGNVWYEFSGHRWRISDNGYGLRKMLTALRDIYKEKQMRMLELSRANQQAIADSGPPPIAIATPVGLPHAVAIDNSLGATNQVAEQCAALKKKYLDISTKLGDTNMKTNIMKEASQLFYDADFVGKLDERTGLLCFDNGVVDFEAGLFRAGRPDDYLSMCTHIDYLPFNPDWQPLTGWFWDTAKHQPIVDDVHRFMSEIYPDAELREYMWQHLASALTGTENQTFHTYIGKGSNGKSVLTKLMADILGDYKRDVPLSLITEKRQKVGGLAPEIAELKGVRYAVMQESSKGDVVNEGVLKQLTSGTDTIQGRGLYNPMPTRFVPQFKLVMCTNELLDIRSMDGGTWRRMRVVSHVSRFVDNPDASKSEFKKLSETEIKNRMTPLWKKMFVSLLVDKALQTKGIVKDCRMVMEASEAYKARQDLIGTFVTEELMEEEGASVKKEKLSTHFKSWWERTQNGKCSKKDELWSYLDGKYGKYDNKKGWRGIRIVPYLEEDDDNHA